MSNIRITAGTLKNMPLEVSQDTRALSEIAKLAVFSIIGQDITDKTCIDLYAGSGNLGLEAVSRGAAKTTFIDNSKFAVNSIKNNIIKTLGRNVGITQEQLEVIQKDVLDFISNDTGHYDIIFMDPPYGLPNKFLLKQITNIMDKNTQLFYFHKKDENYQFGDINPDIQLINTRSYGITTVDLLGLI